MKNVRARIAVAAATLGALTMLPACAGLTGSGNDTGSKGGADGSTKADPKAKVTITVGNKPTPDKKTDLANFNKQVAEFEKQNPNITVKSTTESWAAQTFQARLAGGTLPNVMLVSLTESRSLIENHQLPNITPYLKQLGIYRDLNPLAIKNVEDSNGQIYTIPTGLFSVGMAYNRKLFTEAGLDPNKPPTTWDEVRKDAKIISDKTGKTGYAQLTTNNTGGWMLTTMAYSMGGTAENAAGTKTTIDGPAAKQALHLLHDMRWNDNSMGSQFLYDQDQIRQAFSAGKIGMMLQAPDIYDQAVHLYGMKPADFGEAALPQANGVHGTLTGGSIEFINVKSTPDQVLAALKWVKFKDFAQYYDKRTAITNAKASAESGSAVGTPGLPPVNQQLYDRYMGWIKPQINVPLENFKSYTSTNLKLIPEPRTKAQQFYQQLDPVVQQVLTKKNANIDALLTDAANKIDPQLTR